jgi:hypothetical protein
MSTDLIAQLQQMSLASPSGLNQDMLAVAGRSNNKRLSIEGGVFRKMVNGKEVAKIDERSMDVIFVRMAPSASRTFYDGSYDPTKKSKILCWSSDSRTPDKDVKTPQAPKCDQCAHSIRGAQPSCKLSWRTAIALPSNPSELIQLTLPSKSCFGEGAEDKRPFRPYIQFLGAAGINNEVVITKMQFDTTVQHPRVLFKPNGAVPPEMQAQLRELGQTEEAKSYIELRVYQAPEEEVHVLQPTLGTPGVEAVADPVVEQAEPIAEPVKREAPTQPQPAKVNDVSSIINKWGAKS